jgi:O-antigen/teichoic acid export membrane protein
VTALDAERAAPGPRAQLDRVFRRGFAETFVLDVVARALSAASIVVLIRGLDVSAYAFVTLFLIFAQFLASAAGGGVRLRYLRREAERISRGESRDSVSFGAALASSSVLVAVNALAFLPFVAAFVDVPAAGTAWGLVVYSMGFGIGWGAIELAIAHYQSRKRFRLAGGIGVLRAAAILGVSVLVVMIDASGPPPLALWFVGGMLLAGTIAAAWVLGRRDPSADGTLRERWLFSSEEGWLTAYLLAAAGFAYIDVIVASIFLDERGIATLGATLRYLSVALAAIPAIGAVLRVRVSQTDVVDSGENQRALILHWLRVTVLPGAAVLGISIALVPFVIPLIDGGRYPGSIIALQILLVSAVAAYVSEPGSNVLMAQDRNAALAMLFGVALAVNFVGALLVAPRWGVTGIAVVSSSSFVALRLAVTAYALERAR